MVNVRIHQVIKVGNSLAVTLPVEICRALRIERGDAITFAVFRDNEVVLRRLTAHDVKNINPPTIGG